ncbi:MAG: hypothetical protein ACRCVN_06440 [Spirochaetia bacterium]
MFKKCSYLLLLFITVYMHANKDPLGHAQDTHTQRAQQQNKDIVDQLQQAGQDTQKARSAEQQKRQHTKNLEVERRTAVQQIQHDKFLKEMIVFLRGNKWTDVTETHRQMGSTEGYELTEIHLNYDRFRDQVSGGGIILKLHLPLGGVVGQDPEIVIKVRNFLDTKAMRYKEKKRHNVVEFRAELFPLF